MKVYVYPADVYGCGTVRLIWACNYLRSQGHDVTIVPPSATTGIDGEIDPVTDRVVKLNAPADADVIVLQRVLLKYLAEAIPILRRQRIAVVVDMDDDLTRIDPANVAFAAMHPDPNKIGYVQKDAARNWQHATTACLNATLVTVSTPALLRVYAPHGRGVVLRNCVPAAFTVIPHEDSDVFGWPGSLHSHPKDMLPLGASMARLVREGGEFAVVGPRDGVKEALGLPYEPSATGPLDIQQYPYALADALGVGIAPLADTEFNRSKSWLKPLEMMSLGIPWVASPRAEYVELQRQSGIGLIADKPKSWYSMTKRLITDAAYRQDMSAAGREAVRERYTVEGNAWRMLDAWRLALRTERAGSTNPFSRR